MKIKAWRAHRLRDLATLIRRMYQSIEQFRKQAASARVLLSRLNCRNPSTQGFLKKKGTL
jgi:hypothetical protein